MKIVSGAKYAALQTRYDRTAAALEKAEKLTADRQATITRQATELARLRDTNPDTPVSEPQPVEGDAELRRQLSLAQRTVRELAQRVEELQASHIADTRELHDLRQGVEK